MILFISGFNRSGTTVLVDAVAAATGGSPLTLGDLARYGAPEPAARLRRLLDSPDPVDRGVDSRLVTESLPEEYGWFLYHLGTGRSRSSRFHPAAAPELGRLADAICADTGIAVLKNPVDTGREGLLLRSFPDARVIMMRRSMTGIISSSTRAIARLGTHDQYLRTMAGDLPWIRFLAKAQASRFGSMLLAFGTRWGLRLRLIGFLRTLSGLPVDRIAFLAFEEMVGDPDSGAQWAAHVLDAGRLSKEYHEAFFDGPPARTPQSSWIDRLLDRRWARVWDEYRGEQVRLGVLPPAGVG